MKENNKKTPSRWKQGAVLHGGRQLEQAGNSLFNGNPLGKPRPAPADAPVLNYVREDAVQWDVRQKKKRELSIFASVHT